MQLQIFFSLMNLHSNALVTTRICTKYYILITLYIYKSTNNQRNKGFANCKIFILIIYSVWTLFSDYNLSRVVFQCLYVMEVKYNDIFGLFEFFTSWESIMWRKMIGNTKIWLCQGTSKVINFTDFFNSHHFNVFLIYFPF